MQIPRDLKNSRRPKFGKISKIISTPHTIGKSFLTVWDPHSHGDPHSPCYLPKAGTLIVIAGWPEQPGTLIVIGTLIVVYLLPITTGTLIVLTK